MDKKDEKLVPIFEGGVMEAEIIRALLDEKGISAYVEGEVVTSVMHSLVAPTDTVVVEVLEENVDKAEQCVEEALARAEEEWDEDDEAGEEEEVEDVYEEEEEEEEPDKK